MGTIRLGEQVATPLMVAKNLAVGRQMKRHREEGWKQPWSP